MKEYEVIVAALIIVIPTSIALFGMLKTMNAAKESAMKTETAVKELAKNVLTMATVMQQASQKSTLAGESVAESVRKLEQRLSDSISSYNVQASEERQIAQSASHENRQAIRDSAQGIKDQISELVNRISAMTKILKDEELKAKLSDITVQIDQGSRHLAKVYEAQGEEMKKQLKAIQAVSDSIDKLHATINADVIPLSGD